MFHHKHSNFLTKENASRPARLISNSSILLGPVRFPLVQCLANFFGGGTPKIIVRISRNPCLWWNIYIYKEMVLCIRSLLQYFQLPDNNSRNITRYIYNFVSVFQNSYVSIPILLSEPITMCWGNLWFRETLFEEHYNRPTKDLLCRLKARYEFSQNHLRCVRRQSELTDHIRR
jgi:hypothetical protein